MTRYGLFVGLITLDLVYLVEAPPAPNQKIVALDYTIAAGGPATNAAVAFQYLNRQDDRQDVSSQARLVGTLGRHPLSRLVRSDLEQWGVTIVDLHPDQVESPPTSSILVTQATGDRSTSRRSVVRNRRGVNRWTPDGD